MEMPSVRQLECLVALAKTLNFRQAAELCHITQPALSAQIQHLEANLGLSLFERDRRRVLPTEAGIAMTKRARGILNELRELNVAAGQFSKSMEGTLRLGVIPTIAPYLLPHALGAVRTEFPNLRLLIREGQTAVLLKQLEEGELDLLLLALDVELGNVTTKPLFMDPFVLAVPSDHPLASQESVREEDLALEELMLLEDGHCLRDQTLNLCHSAGACELGDFQASSLSTIVQMVAGGVGITLLPAMSIKVESLMHSNVATIRFADKPPSRSVGLAWRSSSVRGADFELLGALIAREYVG